MLSVHTTPEKIENATIPSQFGFVFEENWVKEIKDQYQYLKSNYRDVFVEKLCFQNIFRHSSGLKNVFEKLLFNDRLV